jgi:hypothetical protein
MVLVREMRLLLIRALNLTKSIVYAKKNARGRVWAVKTWTVSWTTTTWVLPLLLFLYQITRLLVPFIGRCNHENKIFGALRMLLVRPSAMLIIQINALIYRCYSTKKKKKTFRRQPFSSTRFKKRSKHIKSDIFIWKLHEFGGNL